MDERMDDQVWGTVCWRDDDIREAFDDLGIAYDEGKIRDIEKTLRNDKHFEGCMIEAGWNYIFNVIAEKHKSTPLN